MSRIVFGKLEIDVVQQTELQEATDLMIGNGLPSMIVHPELASEAAVLRGIRQGRYKIITAVDWPKGTKKGIKKFHGLPLDAMILDGVEVLLSDGSSSEIQAEIKTITDFVRTHLPEISEIRFVLAAFSRDAEYIERACSILRKVPAPALIRTDHQLRLQQSIASVSTHNTIIASIRKHTNSPIKISGNINNIRTIISCSDAARFAVNLRQAANIISETKREPEKVAKLLEDARK
jgi:hypothetical protein